MTTLSYCKGLPTPANELNALGFTPLEMLLTSYSPVFHKAATESVNHLRSDAAFEKSQWNSHLQVTYGISKRHANGIISFAKGAVDSATECRRNHLKILIGKLKSIEKWIGKAEKKLKNARKFYSKKSWLNSKSGCVFPLSCSIRFHDTNWQNLRFQLHNKKRRKYHLTRLLEHLKSAPIRVKIPRYQVFIVGSKDESFGNQVCQWDGNTLKFRVPSCLEQQFGKYICSEIGDFERNINRLPATGAKTWHFYHKGGKWCVAVQFTPTAVKQVSRSVSYGCIGIDLNPGSIGWSRIDQDGNLKAHGKIPLQMGLLQGKQAAQLVDAILRLAALSTAYACPVVCEQLDFSAKKVQLTERSRKYARMLSGWAYSRFYELLRSISRNRGIELITVNPAYTSLIGLVKYARMYGLASDEAAAIAVARRGMNLSEKTPATITASFSVKEGQYVWSLWNQLNTSIKKSSMRRHSFYAISNWESQVNHQQVEATGQRLR